MRFLGELYSTLVNKPSLHLATQKALETLLQRFLGLFLFLSIHAIPSTK